MEICHKKLVSVTRSSVFRSAKSTSKRRFINCVVERPFGVRDGTSRVKSRRRSGSTGWAERCRRALLAAVRHPAGFWKRSLPPRTIDGTGREAADQAVLASGPCHDRSQVGVTAGQGQCERRVAPSSSMARPS